VWRFRELLYFLIWRDLKVRYRQTVIGAVWAILQPLLTALIFSVIFGYFVRVPTDEAPYPVFAYAALLPWNYTAQAVERSSNSLIEHEKLITKVYFPRLLVPLASVSAPIVDITLAFVVLLAMMAVYGIAPTAALLVLPVFMAMAYLTALAVGLWLAALNVRYRDVRYAIPFLLQVWMYASPIVYPLSVFPEALRPFASLNPMAGIITGFRWALLGSPPPDPITIGITTLVSGAILLGGLAYFKRMERTFADII
jgi:lipopolysaccharide transport system permease protein